MFNICILFSRGCTMQLWRNYFNILLLPANSYYNWGVGQDSTGEDRTGQDSTGEATLCHMRVWWQFPPREPRIISHICRHAASSALDMPPKIYYTTKNMWGRGTVAEEQMTKMIHWLKIVKHSEYSPTREVPTADCFKTHYAFKSRQNKYNFNCK